MGNRQAKWHYIGLETPAKKGELEDLYFVFRHVQNQAQGVIEVDWLRFEF